MEYKDIANVIISVTFIATFIGIFFFTFAAKIEQKIVQEQTRALVADLVEYKFFLPDSAKVPLALMTSTIKTPDMSKADQEAAAHNKALLTKAFKLIFIANVIAVAGVWYLYYKSNFNIINMLKHNLIILGFVGLTELAFLMLIGRYYISADPNYVKYYLVKTINEVVKA
jgi:hypothetical protein